MSLNESGVKSQIGLIGLAVMGQNLSLNIAEKGFDISVFNRSYEKTTDTVKRAQNEKVKGKLVGYEKMTDFVQSLSKPRAIIFLVQAGKPVDAVIEQLKPLLDQGDLIIDGGNEWYQNTERRAAALKPTGIHYMGMGVSGGEEGARYGPSLMPGKLGMQSTSIRALTQRFCFTDNHWKSLIFHNNNIFTFTGGPVSAYKVVEPILTKIAAQVDDGPCVTHIGEGGAGNYVKMIHNGIEYGDMQLIAETYDILKSIGKLSNEELATVFTEYNKSELDSFLIEITANIFKKKSEDNKTYVVDLILDKTGAKGTGKWTVQEGAERQVAVPTMAAALDARNLSSLLEERQSAAKTLKGPTSEEYKSKIDKKELISLVKDALYASKICSYAQGMNLIRRAGEMELWNLNLGAISRIWKGGCIIRAKFLDRIKAAYDKNSKLSSLLVDPEFASEMNSRQSSLRKVVALAIESGIGVPAFSGSLAYYDSYRRQRLPANLTQAQRDYFGAHTYERIDKSGVFHTEWLAEKGEGHEKKDPKDRPRPEND